jgi:hypothetical protein
MGQPTDVLSLADAKSFLRVDFPDDDDLITSLISSGVGLIEQTTQYRLYQRTELIYITDKYFYEAFQYPLNAYNVISVDSANINVYTIQVRYVSLRTILAWPLGYVYWDYWYSFLTNYYYNLNPISPVSFLLTIDVGYTDPTLIPVDLITALKQIISYNYENRDMTKVDLPSNINMMLNNYKRFATVL